MVGLPAPLPDRGALAPGREQERMVAFMGSLKRTGVWAVPRKLEVMGIMSDTKIDLTQAVLPPGGIEIDLNAFMSAVKIVVPPGTRITNSVSAIMANVSCKDDDVLSGGRGASVHLTGHAIMAEVKIVVRKREEIYR